MSNILKSIFIILFLVNCYIQAQGVAQGEPETEEMGEKNKTMSELDELDNWEDDAELPDENDAESMAHGVTLDELELHLLS